MQWSEGNPLLYSFARKVTRPIIQTNGNSGCLCRCISLALIGWFYSGLMRIGVSINLFDIASRPMRNEHFGWPRFLIGRMVVFARVKRTGRTHANWTSDLYKFESFRIKIIIKVGDYSHQYFPYHYNQPKYVMIRKQNIDKLSYVLHLNSFHIKVHWSYSEQKLNRTYA